MAYITLFKSKCFEKFKEERFIEDCSISIMTSLKIDSIKVQRAVDSLVSKC